MKIAMEVMAENAGPENTQREAEMIQTNQTGYGDVVFCQHHFNSFWKPNHPKNKKRKKKEKKENEKTQISDWITH